MARKIVAEQDDAAVEAPATEGACGAGGHLAGADGYHGANGHVVPSFSEVPAPRRGTGAMWTVSPSTSTGYVGWQRSWSSSYPVSRSNRH